MRSFGFALLGLAVGCTDYHLNHSADPSDLGGDTDATDPGDDAVPTGEVGSVRGRICSPSESSFVVGATVWVDLYGGGRVETTTDADGWFLLEGVPTGTATVHVEKGSFSTEFPVEVHANELTELAEEECLTDYDVQIAVVTGAYDSIEKVLDRLGFSYTLINGRNGSDHVTLLTNPDDLQKYDIIFFNCGMRDNWVQRKGEIAQNVRDYVKSGGSVYTSDWSYTLAEAAYPSMVEFLGNDSQAGAAYAGMTGTVHGVVKDPNMISALGSDQADITFDLGAWAVPEGVGSGTALITASFKTAYGNASGPLAVRQLDGDGQILFTSFHNEQQTTLDMDILLEEIILSL